MPGMPRPGGGRGGRGGGSGGTTRPKDLCPNHFKFKDKTWKCAEPETCRMKDKIVKKPEKKET